MDIETEVLSLSVTKHTADILRMLTTVTNGSIHNVADRALRIGLRTIADEREAKLLAARGEDS